VSPATARHRVDAATPGSGYARGVRPLLVAALLGLAACPGARTKGPAPLSPKQIVERSKPAIVRVEVGTDRVGTGFILDASGVVVTNLHVVVGSDDVKVRTLDGTVLTVARVLGLDPEHDLALLDVDPRQPLPTLPLGDSDQVAAGDPVLAIGNPLGVLDYTVSDGLISSVRQLDADVTLLQISAPISQGSSGGPLFNPQGEVIGVATAIFNEGQNLNFGVPSNYVRELVKHPRPLAIADFAALTRPRPTTIPRSSTAAPTTTWARRWPPSPRPSSWARRSTTRATTRPATGSTRAPR